MAPGGHGIGILGGGAALIALGVAGGAWCAQPLPYATPHALPTAPAPVVPRPDKGVAVTFTMVRVHVVGSARGREAFVRARVSPAAGDEGLRLDTPVGRVMDADWVRRQFALNGLVGAPTTSDRVVALVLLINQAFAQSGYLNSGLRFGAQAWPAADGGLDLWLVKGAVVHAGRGRAATIVWAPPHRRHGLAKALAVVEDTGGKPGAHGLRDSFVRDRMPSAEAAPLNAKDVERDFRLLSDDPGLRAVNADLAPGAEPGEAHLTVTVGPAPRVDVYAMAASSRSPSIGGTRYSGGAIIRNALLSGDLLTIDGGETDGLADGFVDYATPFLWPSASLGVRALTDDAAVLAQPVRALAIRSTETNVEVRLLQRLIETPLTPRSEGGWTDAQTLTVGLRFAHDHGFSTLLGQAFSLAPGAVDGVTDYDVLRAGVDYLRRGERQVIALSVTGSFGLVGTASQLPGVVTPDPHFKVILAQMNYARRLTAGGLEFRGRLDAQQASGPLYAPEQFAAGGMDTVRGFRDNLLLADSGVRGSLELDCPLALGHPICSGRTNSWKSVRLALFTDGAYVRDRAGVQPKPLGIASAGFGLGWTPVPGLEANVSYAPARSHAPQPGPQDLQDEGVQFAVTVHPLSLAGLDP
jgi:hemolysin activation/secretion protein